MIVAALGFTTCVPFARALDQISYSKPVLSTPICTFIPKGAYAERRPAEVDLRHRPDAREQARAAVEALPEEGPPVRDERAGHALGLLRGRLGDAARDGEDHERDPVLEAQPATIAAGFKAFRGPTILGPPNVACGKVSKAEPTACGNQTNFYEYLGKGKWKLVSSWLKPPGVK